MSRTGAIFVPGSGRSRRIKARSWLQSVRAASSMISAPRAALSSPERKSGRWLPPNAKSFEAGRLPYTTPPNVAFPAESQAALSSVEATQ